jgi:zinc transporter 1/2/3
MALSTVVLDSKFAKNWASMFAVLFYTFTTPLGIAIGIGINESFNANSQSSLLANGILDGLSAGILLYDGLVNIVTEHFKTASFQKSSNASQFTQFAFLWAGTAIMALIGRWA